MWAVPLGIALITFVAFLPALQNDFVSWDDEKNFLTNPHYRGLGITQLRWMWSTFHLGHYVPLTWMTLGLDYELWGMKPAGYHLVNLLLHCANAVALFFLALRLLGPASGAGSLDDSSFVIPSALAALLFAVHPLRVESVVWVTERRDVLSLLFCLATLLAYLRSRDASRWYWVSVALFVCALLSKATSMSMPAVLLILNVYPLRRLGGPAGWWSDSARRVYRELIPFSLLSAATVVLSIVALRPPDQLPVGAKVAVSAYSLVFYLWKTLVPLHLSPLYEMPQQVRPAAVVFLASYAATMALAVVAWLVRRRHPGATAALLAFVVISLPLLGVVQNGPQIAADRYTYHAAPALAMLAGAAFGVLLERWRVVARTAAVVVVVALAALTWRQSKVWRDSMSLWTHALAVDERSSLAHSAMASLLYKQDRVDEGLAHSQRAVELAPGFAEAHNDLGVGLARKDLIAEAVSHYQQALAIKPSYDEAENNLGVALVRQGDLSGALEHYRRALEINPDNADAQVNWGNVLVRQGKQSEAIPHYQAAIDIRADNADAHLNWGVALAQQGQLAEAIVHFRLALAINPDHAEAKQFLERATQMVR